MATGTTRDSGSDILAMAVALFWQVHLGRIDRRVTYEPRPPHDPVYGHGPSCRHLPHGRRFGSSLALGRFPIKRLVFAGVLALTSLLLLPVYNERRSYLVENASYLTETQQARANEELELSALFGKI